MFWIPNSLKIRLEQLEVKVETLRIQADCKHGERWTMKTIADYWGHRRTYGWKCDYCGKHMTHNEADAIAHNAEHFTAKAQACVDRMEELG
jgi:uncharacterized protein (UPF0332 family)